MKPLITLSPEQASDLKNLITKKKNLITKYENKFIQGPLDVQYLNPEGAQAALFKGRIKAAQDAVSYLETVLSLTNTPTIPADEKTASIYFALLNYNLSTKDGFNKFKEDLVFTIVNAETFWTKIWSLTKSFANVCWYSVKIGCVSVWTALKWTWNNTFGRLFKVKEKETVTASLDTTSTPVTQDTVQDITPPAQDVQEVATVTQDVTPTLQETTSTGEVIEETVILEEVSVETIEDEVSVSIESVNDLIAEEVTRSVEEGNNLSPFEWSTFTDNELDTRATIAFQYASSAIANKQSVEDFAKQHGITIRVAQIVLDRRTSLDADDEEQSESNPIVDFDTFEEPASVEQVQPTKIEDCVVPTIPKSAGVTKKGHSKRRK